MRPTLAFKLSGEFGIGIAFILESVLFAFLSPYFFTPDNLLNVTLQASITAIIAAGMTFVILTGGIDLSVGSIVAFAGIITAGVLKVDLPAGVALALALAVGLGAGALAGAFAGFCITKFNITPFIVTLATMTIARGGAFVVTDGRPVWELPEIFAFLGNGRILAVPVPSIIMALTFIASHIVLTRTRFGRHVYAVGGNIEAARLAGIRTHGVLNRVYILSGMLAALSGILLASRMNSGQPMAGMSYELDVIAAVVVGGTSLSGGKGSIVGTFIGAMLIAVLRNGLNLLNVGSYVQQVIVGAVILLAVMVDQLRRRSA
ncbi:MAG: ribose ABC transporter permease [Bacteroidota bacterium]